MLCAVPTLQASAKTIHFDSNDSAQWTGVGAGSQRLPTHFAGGKQAGEGSIQPTPGSGKLYFADTNIGALSLDDELKAKGRVIWRMNNGERSQRGVHLGFFDKDSYSTFLGLGFYGGNTMSRAFIIHEKTPGAITANAQAPLSQLATGTVASPNNTQSYYFEMLWNPELNELAVAIEGLGAARVQLTPAQRSAFSSRLNAFGFFVPNGDKAAVQMMIDDVTYTTK